MKIGIVIIARNSSSRLPGKILKKIKGKIILDYIIERVEKVINKDNIIIATSTDSTDDLIEYHCKENHINYFRGSLNNVSLRFLEASKKYNLDYSIRINGDNLFVDIPTLNEMINKINSYDLITNVKGRTFPRGMSIEIINVKFYEEVYKKFKKHDDFEHVTKYLYENESSLNMFLYKNTVCPEAANIQMAIDTMYDFIFAKKIINNFEKDHTEYNLKEIYKLYQDNLTKMNFIGKYGPLLIAEIGGNHEGDFEYAKKLTQLAIESDADYIKLQVYSGDTLVNPLLSPDRNKHFKKFELSKEQYIELAEMIEKSGKKFIASIWDISMFSWLDKFMPIYKVGSGDLLAFSLLKAMAKTGKPIILSTGLATEKEILESITFIQSVNEIYKNKHYLSILQCTSMYPIPFSASNLSVMKTLKKLTNLTVGYSDHTEGLSALTYSVAMGAEILEFHFTDTRENKEFRDHKVSLTKEEVHKMIQEIKNINTLLGESKKEPTNIEKMNGHTISFRRGVYLNRDLSKGETIEEKDLVSLRPSEGISSQYFYQVIGKKVLIDIKKYEKLTWEVLD